VGTSSHRLSDVLFLLAIVFEQAAAGEFHSDVSQMLELTQAGHDQAYEMRAQIRSVGIVPDGDVR
jgi:hypothetical protein